MSGPNKKEVTDSLGRVIGYITEDSFGKKTVTNFLGSSLGTSDASGTRDYLGRTISRSDNPGMLIDEEDDE